MMRPVFLHQVLLHYGGRSMLWNSRGGDEFVLFYVFQYGWFKEIDLSRLFGIIITDFKISIFGKILLI